MEYGKNSPLQVVREYVISAEKVIMEYEYGIIFHYMSSLWNKLLQNMSSLQNRSLWNTEYGKISPLHVISAEEVVTEYGRILPVAQKNNLHPLAMSHCESLTTILQHLQQNNQLVSATVYC